MTPTRVSVELRDAYFLWAVSRAVPEAVPTGCRVWARGHAWEGDRHLAAQEMANWLCERVATRGSASRPTFENAIGGLNGNFAVIAQVGDETLAAVDKTRSIPLFYGRRRDSLLLSDDADHIRRFIGEPSVDPLSAKEFLLTGYVTGSETLDPSVRQIQAGEYVCFKSAGLPRAQPVRYFRFSHQDQSQESDQLLSARLEAVLGPIFERLIRSIGTRRIVVPLSGGIDSRAIVAMLKILGLRDVLCFTYGCPRDWEAEISQKVARQLGYEWHFVPYSRKRWREWFHSDERQAFSRYGSQLVSCAHLQDWPAMWALQQTGILQDQDVIVPGHTGDFVSGGHIPSTWANRDQVGIEDVIRAVFEKHYRLWRWLPRGDNLESVLAERVRNRLETDTVSCAADAANAFEKWEWQERQAKFIVNSVRVYEFWGYDWRLPLWDDEMMDYWARVPLSLRFGQRLYRSFLETELFSRLGIGGLHPRQPTGLGGRLVAKVDEFTNPYLGRHSLASQVQAWMHYQRNFGNGLRSRGFFRNPLAMNVSTVLRSVA